MTFWERLGFASPPPARVRHEHFCADHDARWPCFTEPCLLHLVAPCPDKAHP